MALTLAITGGTGFVGRHMIATALDRGHRVRALARQPQADGDGLAWIAGALDAPSALAELVAGADAIIHIAGVTNARDRAGFMAGNVAGTAAMRAAAGRLPFVHVSSLAARLPALSVYGESKHQAEAVVRGVAGPYAMLRPPAVYGPGDKDLLALFKAVRLPLVPIPAHARAAMLYAPDLAQALLALAEDLAGDATSTGQCYEIDDGAGSHSQTDLAQAIADAMGRTIRVLPIPGAALLLGAAADTALARLSGRLPKLSFDRARYLAHRDWSADSRAFIATGLWTPRTRLAEGLAKTIAWYRAEGWL